MKAAWLRQGGKGRFSNGYTPLPPYAPGLPWRHGLSFPGPRTKVFPMAKSRQRVKIRGLVRLMNYVRDSLSSGLPADQLSTLRAAFQQSLQNVEETCHRIRQTPEDLPAPSRRAYHFLKSVDLGRIPLLSASEPVSAPSLRLSGLVKFCNDVQVELMWLASATAAEPAADLAARLRAHVQEIVGMCERSGGTPGSLPVPSRSAFQWLSFLSDVDNATTHVAALRSILERVHSWHLLTQLVPRRHQLPLRLEFAVTSMLYRTQVGDVGVLVRYHEAFIAAPDPVLDALARLAFRNPYPQDRDLVREYVASDDFADVQEELEAATLETGQRAQGIAYDLVEVFARVNTEYFEGRLSMPRLVWSRTPTRYKMGHYHPAADTMMVSTSLDDPRVPPYVVESVIYHEALHKALGIRVINGRRQAHTAEFRAREREFRQYDQAQAFLQEHVRRPLLE